MGEPRALELNPGVTLCCLAAAASIQALLGAAACKMGKRQSQGLRGPLPG
jgi:hypothetical protein